MECGNLYKEDSCLHNYSQHYLFTPDTETVLLSELVFPPLIKAAFVVVISSCLATCVHFHIYFLNNLLYYI